MKDGSLVAQHAIERETTIAINTRTEERATAHVRACRRAIAGQ